MACTLSLAFFVDTTQVVDIFVSPYFIAEFVLKKVHGKILECRAGILVTK